MEFLFDNPIILVILIGIISSFFKKTKEAQQEKQKGNKPKHIRTQKAPSPVGKTRPSRARQQNQPKTKQVKVDKGISWEPSYVTLNNHQEEPLKPTNLMDVGLKGTQNQIEREEAKKTKTLNVDANTLVEGIIWSEVLGPPRAKRPHRAVK